METFRQPAQKILINLTIDNTDARGNLSHAFNTLKIGLLIEF